jgi:enoyl-CoA hydratase/carnithine racemase
VASPDSSAPEPATVLTERLGQVLVVTLNRPATRNAIDGPMADALAAAFRAFETDESLAIAVLTGAGATFCSGADRGAVASGERAAGRLADVPQQAGERRRRRLRGGRRL